MTNAFKPVIRSPGAVAPSGNPKYNTDNVDRAVYNLGSASPAAPSHVNLYWRAKMWVGGSLTSGLVDRLGNPVSSGTFAVDIVKNASDANFNGQASLDLTPLNGLGSSNNGPFQMGPGFKLNGSQLGMTSSFTVVCTGRRLSGAASGVGNLFGTQDGGAGLWGYIDDSGNLQFRPDAVHTSSIAGLYTIGTACCSWYSWDNSAQILRGGKNSTTILASVSNSGTYSPLTSGKANIFGLSGPNSGNAFYGQVEGMLVLDKAYMNGAVPADDALFTTLISAWTSLI